MSAEDKAGEAYTPMAATRGCAERGEKSNRQWATGISLIKLSSAKFD